MPETPLEDHPHPISEISDEGNQSEQDVEEVAAGETRSDTRNLFLMLSSDLLLLVFQWIGSDDKKSFVRLSICSHDPFLSNFIYNECTYLWKEIDLANFPGITDEQLQSLLERVNARSVTTSVVLNKDTSSPITGAGLEPLRHSRVLESIDLRQSKSTDLGPTGLNDELVADILSTVLPHELQQVKVRKQSSQRGVVSTFDQHCFAWGSFVTNLRLKQARTSAGESCNHCDAPLVPAGQHLATASVLGSSTQCTVCKQYSCQPWNEHSSQCPSITECSRCLEWCCSCRPMVMCDSCSTFFCLECEPRRLWCQTCGHSSCSDCEVVRQCKICLDTQCDLCSDDIFTCERCHETFCNNCRPTFRCETCDEWFCTVCSYAAECYKCGEEACAECCRHGVANVAECQACWRGECGDCGDLGSFQKCCWCGVDLCRDVPDCMEEHVCSSPGQIVYSARLAKDGEDKTSLCTCSKIHLTAAKGQKFMCAWLAK